MSIKQILINNLIESVDLNNYTYLLFADISGVDFYHISGIGPHISLRFNDFGVAVHHNGSSQRSMIDYSNPEFDALLSFELSRFSENCFKH